MDREDSRTMEKTATGACLCGAVRFEIAGPLERVAHCHCTICQRAHGAAFVTWAAVPEERLRVTAGEPELTHYRSSEIGTRSGRAGWSRARASGARRRRA